MSKMLSFFLVLTTISLADCNFSDAQAALKVSNLRNTPRCPANPLKAFQRVRLYAGHSLTITNTGYRAAIARVRDQTWDDVFPANINQGYRDIYVPARNRKNVNFTTWLEFAYFPGSYNLAAATWVEGVTSDGGNSCRFRVQ